MPCAFQDGDAGNLTAPLSLLREHAMSLFSLLRPLALAGLLLPAAAQAQQAFISAPAQLYAGPDIDYPILFTLYPGTGVDVAGCLPGYQWCDVILPDGQRGWIYGGSLSYSWMGQVLPVPQYGANIGIPLITFIIGDYWGRNYRNQPWYGEPHHWRHVAPPQRVIPAPPPVQWGGGWNQPYQQRRDFEREREREMRRDMQRERERDMHWNREKERERERERPPVQSNQPQMRAFPPQQQQQQQPERVNPPRQERPPQMPQPQPRQEPQQTAPQPRQEPAFQPVPQPRQQQRAPEVQQRQEGTPNRFGGGDSRERGNRPEGGRGERRDEH